MSFMPSLFMTSLFMPSKCMPNRFSRTLKGVLAACLLLCHLPLHAAALMDLVDIEGIRDNQLIGYGLVVGLDGTGDKNQVKFTSQSVTNMIKQFGINLPANIDPKLKNVAAVTVTAVIPPSYSPGQTVDVTVASLGDAKSLRGGQLLMTQLHGVDGEVYALAQGALIIGGVNAQGMSGSSVAINTSNSGLIPNGATVERMIPTDFAERNDIVLNLRNPSFQTAHNVVGAINKRFGTVVASADNPTKVTLMAPKVKSQRLSFMAMLENIEVSEGRNRPKVVFNSRTGTVVVGEGVRVKAAAVSHGALTVTINETSKVSQPGAFSNGQTAVVPNSDVQVSQETNAMFKWPDGTSLDSIINTINTLGASPDDVMSILQALEQAGALNAELLVI
jgi:flagellar P-ring protein precursor FlgI